jgi:CBS-domain-containing membrane protein
MKMQVQEIMVRDAKSCRMDTNLAAATAIMWNTDCGALPVLDGGEKVVGMITDRDICIAAGTRNWIPSEIKVSDVVPQKVFTCSAEEDIHAALKTMQTRQVRRLPVVGKDGKLQGILCLDDVAVKASKRNSLSYEDTIETFKAVCDHRTARQATAA